MQYVIMGLLGAIVLVALFFVIRYWARIRVFYAEVVQEMQKVTWPTQQEVIQSTVLVFVVTIIMTIGVGVIDSIFGYIVRLMFVG